MSPKRKAESISSSSSPLLLAQTIIDELAINQGKQDRLKDASTGSHTSLVTAENLVSLFTEHEVERKCNVDQWFKKVRKVLVAFLLHLSEKHPSAQMDISSFIHLLSSLHPPTFLDRPPAQTQQPLPDHERCIASCGKEDTRCFRQRHRSHPWLCTYHQSYLPFGVVSAYHTTELFHSHFELPLRLVNYRGFYVYIDLLNNNVYDMKDIYEHSTTPRILGKYSVHTDETTLEEEYCIPVLDARVMTRAPDILRDA
jgi:hypothetical protein